MVVTSWRRQSPARWNYVELVSCMNLCCWGHLACCALRGFHVGREQHAEQDLHPGRRRFHNLKEVRKEEKEKNKGKGAHCQGHREMNHNHLTQVRQWTKTKGSEGIK